jgi:hypothetical protein
MCEDRLTGMAEHEKAWLFSKGVMWLSYLVSSRYTVLHE